MRKYIISIVYTSKIYKLINHYYGVLILLICKPLANGKRRVSRYSHSDNVGRLRFGPEHSFLRSVIAAWQCRRKRSRSEIADILKSRDVAGPPRDNLELAYFKIGYFAVVFPVSVEQVYGQLVDREDTARSTLALRP